MEDEEPDLGLGLFGPPALRHGEDEQPHQGGPRVLSRPGLRYRGDWAYHDNAEEQLGRLTSEFETELETRANRFAKQEGLSTVDGKHVVRAYDTIVARETKKRSGEKISDVIIGASLSGLIALFIEMSKLDGPPSAGQLWLLAGLIVLLVGSAAYSSWSLER